jgi:glycerol-3-phosphate responsive antiterminator
MARDYPYETSYAFNLNQLEGNQAVLKILRCDGSELGYYYKNWKDTENVVEESNQTIILTSNTTYEIKSQTEAVENIKITTIPSDEGYIEKESSWPNYAAVLYDKSGSQIAAFDIWDDMARDYPYETSYAFNLNQLEGNQAVLKILRCDGSELGYYYKNWKDTENVVEESNQTIILTSNTTYEIKSQTEAVENIKITTIPSDEGYIEKESSWPNYAAVLYDKSGSQLAAFDIWDDMARDYPYETSYAFNLNQLEGNQAVLKILRCDGSELGYYYKNWKDTENVVEESNQTIILTSNTTYEIKSQTEAVENIKITTIPSDEGYIEKESSWPNYAAVLYDKSGSQLAAFDIWDDMARDYPYETSYAFNLNQLEETRQC